MGKSSRRTKSAGAQEAPEFQSGPSPAAIVAILLGAIILLAIIFAAIKVFLLS